VASHQLGSGASAGQRVGHLEHLAGCRARHQRPDVGLRGRHREAAALQPFEGCSPGSTAPTASASGAPMPITACRLVQRPQRRHSAAGSPR
jgi:hypothetical protein